MSFLIIAAMLTILIVYFLICFSRVSQEEVIEIVISLGWKNKFAGDDIVDKCEDYVRRNEKYNLYTEKKLKRKIKADQKQLDVYRKAEKKYMSGGEIGVLDLIPVFGYHLCEKLGLDTQSDVLRELNSSCERAGYLELERGQETVVGATDKKNSMIYSRFLLASVASYLYFGVIGGVFSVLLLLAAGKELKLALLVCVVIVLIMGILGYLPLDAMNVKAQKRREEIDREFPNVVSKLTLLTLSGMNIVKAMEQAAGSGEGLMYQELTKVVKEVGSASSMQEALAHLQNRCENKYLDKMVTIMAKSYVGGNKNLADDLKALNDECWLEKKHSARRMADKVQTKLFIPTMLMFVGILVVIIIPVMSGFSF